MVWSLEVLALKTTFWLVEILWQPIRSFYSMVFETKNRNKTQHIMWTKTVQENSTISFEVTLAFCKMCILAQAKGKQGSRIDSLPEPQSVENGSCRGRWLRLRGCRWEGGLEEKEQTTQKSNIQRRFQVHILTEVAIIFDWLELIKTGVVVWQNWAFVWCLRPAPSEKRAGEP